MFGKNKEKYNKEYSTVKELLEDFPVERRWDEISKLLLKANGNITFEAINTLVKEGVTGAVGVWSVDYYSVVALLSVGEDSLHYAYFDFRNSELFHKGGLDSSLKVVYGPHPRQLRNFSTGEGTKRTISTRG